MNKRFTVGGLFCVAAAILFAARYIATSIGFLQFQLQPGIWESNLLTKSMSYAGSTSLLITSILCFVIGALYLFFAELEEWKKRQKQKQVDLLDKNKEKD